MLYWQDSSSWRNLSNRPAHFWVPDSHIVLQHVIYGISWLSVSNLGWPARYATGGEVGVSRRAVSESRSCLQARWPGPTKIAAMVTGSNYPP